MCYEALGDDSGVYSQTLPASFVQSVEQNNSADSSMPDVGDIGNTGMTAQEMLDAGATADQVAQIQAAQNTTASQPVVQTAPYSGPSIVSTLTDQNTGFSVAPTLTPTASVAIPQTSTSSAWSRLTSNTPLLLLIGTLAAVGAWSYFSKKKKSPVAA